MATVVVPCLRHRTQRSYTLTKIRLRIAKHKWRYYSQDHNETYEDKSQAKHHAELYSHHIPTTFFQKSLLTVGSSLMSILNPSRDDMIAILGETTGLSALQKIKSKMLQDAEGQEILRIQPKIHSSLLNMDYLRSLPQNTFGRSYIQFLDKNKVTPDSRLPVQFIDDVEFTYVMQRYREVHDLLHTLLGMPTNMLGEVAVKWVEAIQTGLPMCILGAIFGPLRLRPK